ncbi:MAG: bifunctional UDP-sugar hydrolase/5'-nucleotidase [Pyrinomonadaceae bacterium]
MINRRRFLKNSVNCSALILARPLSCLSRLASDTVITVLHTNDTHSQIDPISASDKTYPNKGGVARRATLVKQMRSQNPNTLLIDAGDAFQGTPYFNYYKGEVEYRSMSAIGYDAGTLGNHEFDNGVDALAAALRFATFDMVSTNYVVKGTSLESFVKPYVVKTVSGIRIGLFGLGINPIGLITPTNFKGVTYRDPVQAAAEVVTNLRQKEDCSLIVAMSHLGYYEHPKQTDVGDAQVAAQVNGIDFIASGHTHIFMQKPVSVRQPSGKETLIFQVGRSGIYLGRVDFTFRTGKLIAATGRLLDSRQQVS